MKWLFVSILLAFLVFPPLAAKLIGPQTGCQFFLKNVDFSDNYPLKTQVHSKKLNVNGLIIHG